MACASSWRLRKKPGMLRNAIGSMSNSTPAECARSAAQARFAVYTPSSLARSTSLGAMPAIACIRGHSSASAYSVARRNPSRNSCSRPGNTVMPRSPAFQSPGGELKSTWRRPCSLSSAASVAAGYSYGKRYSTALKPSRAAAAKRSRKLCSVYIIVRLAAKRGIAFTPSIGRWWISIAFRAVLGGAPLFSRRIQGRNLVIHDRRNGELDKIVRGVEGNVALGSQQFDACDSTARGKFEADLLWPDGIKLAEPSVMRVGICVVQHVNGEAWLSFPRENLHEPFALHADQSRASDPADRVREQAAKIGLTREPHRRLDVARKVGQAAHATFAQHHGRLIGVGRGRIRKLWRVSCVTGHDGEHWIVDRLQRQAKLRARDPVRIGETIENRVRPLDPRHVWICVSQPTDHRTCRVDFEYVGQPEVRAALIALVVHTGLKCRQQRSALVYVLAQLLALRVAEQRGVGQNESRVLFDPLQLQTVFVNEVEEKSSFEKRGVHRIHILLHGHVAWRLIKELRPLSHYHTNIGDGALVHPMRVVPRCPLEIIAADLFPAKIFAEAVLSAHDVIVGNHSASQRLAGPDHGFGSRLGHFAPANRPGRVRARKVGGHLAVEHGVAHAALLCCAPDGRIPSVAALVVALKPLTSLAQLGKIRRGVKASAHISDVEARCFLILRD